MADFKQGDRVVKMSGVCAGKYGTVNSVREDGTLNVTFDGERLPRFCDPQRCGAVAANAKFKVGQKVKLMLSAAGVYGLGIKDGIVGMTGTITKAIPETDWADAEYEIGGRLGEAIRKAGILKRVGEDDLLAANSRAANAKFKVGDRVIWHKRGEAEKRRGVVVEDGPDRLGGVTLHDEYGMEWSVDAALVAKAANSRAANAKFKVGDRVLSKEYPELGEMKVVRVFQDIHGTAYRTSRDGFLTDDIHYDRTLIPANSRARNADTPEGRRFIDRAKSLMRGARDKSDLAAVRDRMVRELRGSAAISDDEKDALEGELFHAHGEEVRRRGRNAVARNAD